MKIAVCGTSVNNRTDCYFNEVQNVNENVYTPLDRSAVAAQKTYESVGNGKFNVEILAIR
jgi:hypothetical protein